MSSVEGLIGDRDEWEDRARSAEAELVDLRKMLGRLTHEIDRLRIRCEQFENTGPMVAMFRELAAVLRSMQDPAAADREPAPVVPLKARSS